MHAVKRLLLLTMLLSACGSDPVSQAPEPKRSARTASPELRPPPEAEAEARREEGEDAAAALRRYYDRIERGDYAGAWEMRGEDDSEANRRRFADNFKAYERYRAEIGTPSLPAAAAGYEYVEVPVMITGAYHGGKAFGSTGSVTLRRATSADAAGPRGWTIYTGRESKDRT
jgi:hypothetical protein